jgi:hypothetical protein
VKGAWDVGLTAEFGGGLGGSLGSLDARVAASSGG